MKETWSLTSESLLSVAGTWSEGLNQICLMRPFPFPPTVPSRFPLSLRNASRQTVQAPGPGRRTAGTLRRGNRARWAQRGVPTRDGADAQLPLPLAKTAERPSNALGGEGALEKKRT